MLRRDPTRIELKLEDILEFDSLKKDCVSLNFTPIFVNEWPLCTIQLIFLVEETSYPNVYGQSSNTDTISCYKWKSTKAIVETGKNRIRSCT